MALGRVYVPRIYGFKVSERARSGPRMKWLRERPERWDELERAQRNVGNEPVGEAGAKVGEEKKKGALFDDEDDEDDDDEEEEEEDAPGTGAAGGPSVTPASVQASVLVSPAPGRR
jgi:casein kinase II subunit beta